MSPRLLNSMPRAEMNDALIRERLHHEHLRPHHRCPRTLVLDEFGIRHGRCRADIAVVNGTLSGYEIKSERDSLSQLGDQIQMYSAVFDHAVVVAARMHVKGALRVLPDWWGLISCFGDESGVVRFEMERQSKLNPSVDAVAVAQLLWKAEVADILAALGQPASVLRERRGILYERLVDSLPLRDLQQCVRERLKRRKSWRRHERPSLGGG